MAGRLIPYNVPQPSQASVFNRPPTAPISQKERPPFFLPTPRTLDPTEKTEVFPSSFPGHIVEELCKSLRLTGGQREGGELKQLWHLDWESSIPRGWEETSFQGGGVRPEIENPSVLLSVTLGGICMGV